MSDGKITVAVTIPAGLILVVAVWLVLHHGSDDSSARHSEAEHATAATQPAEPTQGETAARDRLAQLEAQNRQLSAELAKQQQADAQRRAVELSKPGEIDGAAWVVRKSGQSDIVRGLNVCVLPMTCPRATVLQCLTDAISDCNTEEDELRKFAQQARDQQNSFNAITHEKKVSDLAVAYDKGIEKLESQIADIRTQMAQVPQEMDLIQAAELVKKFALLSPPTAHLFDLARSQVRTDVDGKYRIPVMPGNWIIAGQTGGSEFVIQWFVPITMSPSGHLQLNLDNSNSFSITNATSLKYN